MALFFAVPALGLLPEAFGHRIIGNGATGTFVGAAVSAPLLSAWVGLWFHKLRGHATTRAIVCATAVFAFGFVLPLATFLILVIVDNVDTNPAFEAMGTGVATWFLAFTAMASAFALVFARGRSQRGRSRSRRAVRIGVRKQRSRSHYRSQTGVRVRKQRSQR